MIRHLLKQRLKRRLQGLQHKSGLLSASSLSSTGYDKAWIRDNVYEALGFEQVNDHSSLRSIFHGLLNIFLKHESKIDAILKGENLNDATALHPRYCPVSLEELPGKWANVQHDAIGAFLFKIGDLHQKGLPIIRDDDDFRIIRKLVLYLDRIEYWRNPDAGMWEQDMAIRSSSIGACLAGLEKISCLVDVEPALLQRGREALDRILPFETEERKVDLALLSLIFPYAVVSEEQASLILQHVENHLVREHGLIRFEGDWYYHNGQEAEWTFGFPWLAVIYRQRGDKQRYRHYLNKTKSHLKKEGDMPELYLGGTDQHNENIPLGWGVAMAICALSSRSV